MKRSEGRKLYQQTGSWKYRRKGARMIGEGNNEGEEIWSWEPPSIPRQKYPSKNWGHDTAANNLVSKEQGSSQAR